MLVRDASAMAADLLEERVRDWIAKRTKDHWDAYHGALLLSDLGSGLRREVPEGASVMTDGLRRFLITWPVVKVVPHPEIPQKVGVVPLDATLPSDLSELFTRRRSFNSGISFNRNFWHSFFTPLGNKRRFVILPSSAGETLRIIDTDDAPEDKQAYEIFSDDLATPPIDLPAPEKARITAEKIRAWLARHGLSEAQFAEGQDDRVLRAANRPSGNTSQPFTPMSRSPALGALERLEFSDQARIFVPLDVVLKLLSRER